MTANEQSIRGEEWQRLTALLPPTEQLSTVSESDARGSFWTPGEIAKGERANILRALKAGWKWDNGYLRKGQISSRPSQVMPSKSGDMDFNPRVDAFAVRLGAVFVKDNYYRLSGGLYCDRNGMLWADECSECGGGGMLGVRKRDPYAKRWELDYTFCRQCATGREIAERKRRAEEAQPQPRGRRT